MFTEHWLITYGIPTYLLDDSGDQFVGKLFATVCTLLRVTHLTTMVYHPQTNGQAKLFNKTMLSRHSHYISEHRKNCDTLVLPLTYAYNTQVHRSTKQTRFSIVPSRQSPGPILIESGRAHATDGYVGMSPQLLRTRSKACILTSRAIADVGMASTQQRYKLDYDHQVRRTTTFQLGGWVFIDMPPPTTTSNTIANRPASSA